MLSKNLQGCFNRLGIACSLILTPQVAGAIIFSTNCALAQITPDPTLPNNSNVRLEGNTRTIEGGTRAGGNLFHSFAEFSVPIYSTAHFNNSLDIQNIITRVTGNSMSNINGLIRANGTANLFLINPNGIIFGQNARLDIGGSFFATSANSMKFADGFEFSAKNPQPTPLLTISVPIGLQFGANPGLIQVIGNGQGARDLDSPIIDTLDALRVQPDKTLALVGGDINLFGATLKTAGGRIELGSVGSNGLVSLTPTNKGFALGYGGVQSFGNIQLSQQATVDASGEGGGDIQVQARGVTLTQGSQIETSTLGAKQGGDLVVNATESVEVSGSSSFLDTQVYPKATGDSGNLRINTRELLIRDGAVVGVAALGTGKGGNLAVTADSVQVVGISADGSTSKLTIQTKGTGNARDLRINTRELLIRDGGGVFTDTTSAGNGGNLTVTADSVQVIGTSSEGRDPSILSAQANSGSTGDAGDLTINTHQLLVRSEALVSTQTFGAGKGGNLDIQARELLIRDGAQVGGGTFGIGKGGSLAVTANSVQVVGVSADGLVPSALSTQASADSTGDAGDLTINTRELIIRDGAFVSAGTFAAGKGGNLAVTTDSVQVIGRSSDDRYVSSLSTQVNSSGSTGNAGDLKINTRELLIRDGAFVSASTIGAGKGGNLAVTADSVQVIGTSGDGSHYSSLFAQSNGTGNAGDLKINTRELLIRDGARVSASTIGGKATAGDITVDANSIVLNNAARINADTNGGGGNIFVNSPLLQLRRGSSITTNASGDNITGGNITIDAKNGFIIAVENENSDIRADSANFRGGNVTIKNIAGIFGIQPRKEPSSQTSDITAKGATPELSGTLQISNPEVDIRNGLVPLPVEVVDVARLVDDNICARTAKSSFTYTGRGGLPPSPNNTLNSDVVWEDWQLTSVPQGAWGSGGVGETRLNVHSSGSLSSSQTQIVPAQGWIINKNGDVTLTAYAPTATPHKVGSSSDGCQPPIAK